MRFKVISFGRTTRVYVSGLTGFETVRVWFEPDNENMCKLVCPKAPAGRYRTSQEIEDAVRVALLHQGYDMTDVTFLELKSMVEDQFS
jgi:hypothetical protein